MPEDKFHVGDIVECTEEEMYSLTDIGVPCRVTAIHGAYLSVEIVDACPESDHIECYIWRNNNQFEVDADYFMHSRMAITPERREAIGSMLDSLTDSSHGE